MGENIIERPRAALGATIALQTSIMKRYKASTNSSNKSVASTLHKANQVFMLWEISILERSIGKHI